MAILKGTLRFLAAIIGGLILGQLCAIPIAILLDVLYGRIVTGEPWEPTTPNFIYSIVIALFTGFFAGWIAKKRGALVAAITVFSPLLLAITMSLMLNTDLLYNWNSTHTVTPASWLWISLIPAMVGGYWGQRKGTRTMVVVATGIAAMSMFAIWIGGTALHVYTIVLAYQVSGLASAVTVGVFPVFAEIFWFFKMWTDTGHFVNGYSVWVFALLITYAVVGACMVAVAKMENSKAESTVV